MSTVNRPPHILIVEDEAALRTALRLGLEDAGYLVSEAANRAAAHSALTREPRVDLITLDLMLGDDDGFDIARDIRSTRNIPIIMITALNDPVDRVMGLERGADDYIVKPFHIREVILRVQSVLRRYELEGTAHTADGNERYRCGAGTIDATNRLFVGPSGDDVALTDAEFDILLAFARNPARVLSRDDLSLLLKGRLWSPTDRTLDGHIARLRKKIEPDLERLQFIKTVWGVGYVLAAPVERLPPGDPPSATRKASAS